MTELGLHAGARPIRSASSRRTAGNVAFTTTTFTAVDTATDLTVAAKVGDTLQVWPNIAWNNSAGTARLDAATMVSGSPVNWLSSRTSSGSPYGVQAWGSAVASAFGLAGPPTLYTVQSGDVSAGTVTLRFFGRVDVAATTRSLISGPSASGTPVDFHVVNLG